MTDHSHYVPDLAGMIRISDTEFRARVERTEALEGTGIVLREPVSVPDGWKFYSADFSMQAAGKSSMGRVMLTRDLAGMEAWFRLSGDEQKTIELYVSGEGRTINEAIADAATSAMLAAAPKVKS